MKKSFFYPQDQVFWYLKDVSTEKLSQNLKTEVLVIGGGMAGLSAAQRFQEKGFQVTLIEKYFCGSGASGKSSGFITQDSELGLSFFVNQFGSKAAQKIWRFGASGVEFIRKNIKDFSIACDYQESDVLVVANAARDFKALADEYEDYKQLAFDSKLYTKEDVPQILGSEKYYGALRLENTFGINSFLYCQAMKELLRDKGVSIYENTPAEEITNTQVRTPQATITADYIVVCIDRYLPEIDKLSPDVFHAQTFLMISYPLSQNEITALFPQGQLMVWDTELVYNYYRIVDGNRLLIGGSNYLYTFLGQEQHNSHMIYRKLSGYIKDKFPQLDINFEFIWPGLIGVSKDVMPIATADKKNPNIFYITCATGLPWAAALGAYSADRIADNNREFDQFFTVDRSYPLGNWVQMVLGKRITFSISNLINLYFRS